MKPEKVEIIRNKLYEHGLDVEEILNDLLAVRALTRDDVEAIRREHGTTGRLMVRKCYESMLHFCVNNSYFQKFADLLAWKGDEVELQVLAAILKKDPGGEIAKSIEIERQNLQS